MQAIEDPVVLMAARRSGRLAFASCRTQKRAAPSRPQSADVLSRERQIEESADHLGAIRDFQFPWCTDLHGVVKLQIPQAAHSPLKTVRAEIHRFALRRVQDRSINVGVTTSINR